MQQNLIMTSSRLASLHLVPKTRELRVKEPPSLSTNIDPTLKQFTVSRLVISTITAKCRKASNEDIQARHKNNPCRFDNTATGNQLIGQGYKKSHMQD